jgi:hypothetical protein
MLNEYEQASDNVSNLVHSDVFDSDFLDHFHQTRNDDITVIGSTRSVHAVIKKQERSNRLQISETTRENMIHQKRVGVVVERATKEKPPHPHKTDSPLCERKVVQTPKNSIRK